MARVKRLARSRAQDAGPAHGECSLFSSLGQKGDFSPCPPPLALGSAQPRDNQGDFRAQPDGRSPRAGRPAAGTSVGHERRAASRGAVSQTFRVAHGEKRIFPHDSAETCRRT